MKFLKKLSLAASIAAVSVAANAEMVAMDEASLSAATGQAGIDINMQVGAITVGEVEYTDTDVDADGYSGSLSISGVGISSADLNYAIDIAGNGDLSIVQTNTVSGMTFSVASVDLLGTDNGGTVGDTSDDTAVSTNLLSNLSLNIDLGTSATTISSNGSDTVIDMASSFKINSGSVDLLNGAIGISSITFDDDGANVTTDVTVTANSTDGLAVAVNAINGDLTLGGIAVGGATLGDISVSDIAMSGTTFTIKGH